jgi:hypothetical protein
MNWRQVKEEGLKLAVSLVTASYGASFDEGTLKFENQKLNYTFAQNTTNVEQRPNWGKVGMNGAWSGP